MLHRYQIRIPSNSRIEDLFEEVVDTASRNVSQVLGRAIDRNALKDKITSELLDYFHAYDLCGSWRECSEEIEGSPWLDFNDRIYLLVVSDGFDSFIQELVLRTLSLYSKEDLEGDVQEKITLLLRAEYRRIFAMRLYYNPLCRKLEICERSVPVNVLPVTEVL